MIASIPRETLLALRANDRAGRESEGDHDPLPLVKLFNPLGAATWLVTELGEDGDTVFGLADLGFGCPELGYFSLSEIGRIRLPYGLKIERDAHFVTRHTLSVWAAWSRKAGSILWAETLLARVELSLDGKSNALPFPVPDRSRDG